MLDMYQGFLWPKETTLKHLDKGKGLLLISPAWLSPWKENGQFSALFKWCGSAIAHWVILGNVQFIDHLEAPGSWNLFNRHLKAAALP